MKALPVLLLGAVLCLDSGSSLHCYSCSPQLSNSKCQTQKECNKNETCRTDVFRIRGFFNIIIKDCEASCKESYQDFSIGRIAGTVLWIFLNNRL
ncbi:PREDICTED: prostate stem cell antigen-like [Buceros rhinoceros silvestris]|uniref:prostate stem cell antigen-like n=1 Tax=Buceros rhinoceros silvestris TaxID=175836 RepID=UPI0005286F57|nr:PREDICTED: prostate stem cell antigen-like [Buceros rhinoceros silvestris]